MSERIPMPWEPAPYDEATCGAFQALMAGNANGGQQQLAVKWIVETLCGYADLSFRPGPDGDRATAFAEGKRFVAAQVVKMTKPQTAAALSKAKERAVKKEARNV